MRPIEIDVKDATGKIVTSITIRNGNESHVSYTNIDRYSNQPRRQNTNVNRNANKNTNRKSNRNANRNPRGNADETGYWKYIIRQRAERMNVPKRQYCDNPNCINHV